MCVVLCVVLCVVGCVVDGRQTPCPRAFRCVVGCVVGCAVGCVAVVVLALRVCSRPSASGVCVGRLAGGCAVARVGRVGRRLGPSGHPPWAFGGWGPAPRARLLQVAACWRPRPVAGWLLGAPLCRRACAHFGLAACRGPGASGRVRARGWRGLAGAGGCAAAWGSWRVAQLAGFGYWSLSLVVGLSGCLSSPGAWGPRQLRHNTPAPPGSCA